MTNLVLRIVFSGLVMLASEEVPLDHHSALLVNDRVHGAVVLLAEGHCEGCQEDPLLEPYFQLVWDLKGDPSILSFPEITQRPSLRLPGRSMTVSGEASSLPTNGIQAQDTSWIPSLKALAGGTLHTECFSKERLDGCGDGPVGRFVIPGGRIASCHLAHAPDVHQPRNVHEACAAVGQHSVPNYRVRVLRAEFAPCSDCRLPPQAVADAFMVELELQREEAGKPLVLQKVSEGGRLEQQKIYPSSTSTREERITLLVLNEASSRSSGRGWLGGLEVASHGSSGAGSHFRQFYSLFEETSLSTSERPVPRMEQQGASEWVDAGLCEPYFVCLDSLFQAVQAAPGLLRAKSPIGSFRFAIVHSPTECGTSTQP